MSFLYFANKNRVKIIVYVLVTISILVLMVHTAINISFVQRMQNMDVPVGNIKSYPFLFGTESLSCSSEHLYSVSALLNISGAKVLFISDGVKLKKIDANTAIFDGFPVMSISDDGIVILRSGIL